MTYRVEVRRTDGAKPWYWRIVAGNGAALLTSETYATRSNARRAAWKFLFEVRRYGPSAFSPRVGRPE